MSGGRWLHSATLLPSGRVLVAGGSNDGGPTVTATADLFDPVTGTWTSTGSMAQPRMGHTATLLRDGTVLVAGGFDDTGANVADAEVYVPATGARTPVGAMGSVEAGHTATLLSDGTVLVVARTPSPTGTRRLRSTIRQRQRGAQLHPWPYGVPLTLPRGSRMALRSSSAGAERGTCTQPRSSTRTPPRGAKPPACSQRDQASSPPCFVMAGCWSSATTGVICRRPRFISQAKAGRMPASSSRTARLASRPRRWTLERCS